MHHGREASTCTCVRQTPPVFLTTRLGQRATTEATCQKGTWISDMMTARNGGLEEEVETAGIQRAGNRWKETKNNGRNSWKPSDVNVQEKGDKSDLLPLTSCQNQPVPINLGECLCVCVQTSNPKVFYLFCSHMSLILQHGL